MNYQLILASQSPRRKELLGWIKVPFIIRPADIDEEIDEQDPRKMVETLALAKAQATLEMSPETNPLIIASDTTVFLGQTIFAKPNNTEHAREILQELSGKTHTVFTAVSILSRERSRRFSVATEVTFQKITEDVMAPYLESGDSLDKAGAYGIQGMGLTFVKSIQGSYSNVVGFPLAEFIDELKAFLAPDLKKSSLDSEEWRALF